MVQIYKCIHYYFFFFMNEKKFYLTNDIYLSGCFFGHGWYCFPKFTFWLISVATEVTFFLGLIYLLFLFRILLLFDLFNGNKQIVNSVRWVLYSSLISNFIAQDYSWLQIILMFWNFNDNLLVNTSNLHVKLRAACRW